MKITRFAWINTKTLRHTNKYFPKKDMKIRFVIDRQNLHRLSLIEEKVKTPPQEEEIGHSSCF